MAQNVHFILPSNGRELTASPLTAGQLGQLTSRKNRGPRSIELLSKHIVPQCTQLQPDEYKTLLIPDGEAVMVALVRATYGDELDYKLPCPECDSKEAYCVDLSKMALRCLVKDAPTSGHCFTYEYRGKALTYVFHIPTVEDQIKSTEEAHKLKEQHPSVDFDMILSIKITISEIKGLTDVLEGPTKSQAILEHLFHVPADFLNVFQERYNAESFGHVGTVKHRCQACGKEFEADLPLLQSFFSREREGLKKARLEREKNRDQSIRSYDTSSLTSPISRASV